MWLIKEQNSDSEKTIPPPPFFPLEFKWLLQNYFLVNESGR